MPGPLRIESITLKIEGPIAYATFEFSEPLPHAGSHVFGIEYEPAVDFSKLLCAGRTA